MGVWRHDKLSISRSFVPFFHDSKPPSVAVNTAAQNKRLPAFLWPMVGRWPYEQTNEISVNEFWEATSITLVGICGTCATTDSTNHRPCSTVCVCSVTQPCPALCHPMNCSPPGFSIHRISQARILEWVAGSISRGSSQPRDQWLIFPTTVSQLVKNPPKSHKRGRFNS